jgi:asparagine synthase (glutamine-hydrolysing)
MCGITVIIASNNEFNRLPGQLKTMEAEQIHRGPDYQGMMVERAGDVCAIGLGHQRLSILDLSPSGHQPMISPCQRYVLVFNGEIYNYVELAEGLRDDPILDISPGDSAVLLALLARHGVSALNQLNGMWALAFYDRVEKRLIVSRDRMGVKPLYVYQEPERIILASEIKTILKVAGRRFPLNRDVVARYLIQSITDGQQETFFEGLDAFPAASYAALNLKNPFELPLRYERFWKHPYERNAGSRLGPPSVADIRETFLDGVQIRLRSDVPVGVLLSGGIDSSSILGAIKTTNSLDNISILSVVSDDPEASEEYYIDLMAAYAGCKTIKKVRIDYAPLEILQKLPEVCWYNDQPVQSLSVVAHRLLMQKARAAGITVILDGQGADEQLGGYNKFCYFYLLDCLRRGKIGKFASMIVGCLKNNTILHEFTMQEAKRYFPSLIKKKNHPHLGKYLEEAKLLEVGQGKSYQEREWLDLKYYSVPMLLHYEDRMSMSVAREIRLPFMDYRLVELLAGVDPDEKLSLGWTKQIFRQAIEGIVPKEIQWRKDKKGFTVPEAKWFRQDFQEHILNLFSRPMYSAELEIIRNEEVKKLYQRYLQNDPLVNYKDILNIVSLEMWCKKFAGYIQN